MLLVLGVIIILVNGSLLTTHPILDDNMAAVNHMREEEKEMAGMTGGAVDENSHADLIATANSLDFRLHERQAVYMFFGAGLTIELSRSSSAVVLECLVPSVWD